MVASRRRKYLAEAEAEADRSRFISSFSTKTADPQKKIKGPTRTPNSYPSSKSPERSLKKYQNPKTHGNPQPRRTKECHEASSKPATVLIPPAEPPGG